MQRLWGRIWADWPGYVVIFAGLLVSMALAMASFRFFLTDLIPDDSFYYFQMARNIVHGLGPTFDGIHMTNGYHPLWLLVLLPIFKFFSSGVSPDVVPIHVTLLVSAILNASLGVVLLRIISRYTTSPWIKAIALSVWFFNPFNLYEMMNGLETSLSLFFVALFILCAIRFSEQESRLRLVKLGIVGGLMMLARLDNVLYFVALLAWLVYRDGLYRSIPRVLWVGIVATIVVAPWLIWNATNFHMLFTSSSEGVAIVNHQLIVQDHGTSAFQTLKAGLYSTDYYLRMVMLQTGAPSMFFILLGASIGWLLFESSRNKRLFSIVPVEWFLFGGFAANFIVNASIRWTGRTWYFVAFNLFTILLLAWFLEKLRDRPEFPKKTVAALLCLTVLIFAISWSKDLRGRQVQQLEIVAASQWIDANLPPDATVGVFNAGIEGYISHHRIVNLDGLVNNSALEALKNKDLWNYIKSEHIDYLADFPYFSYRYGSFFGVPDPLTGLKLVHATAADDAGINIYKVQ